MPCDVARLFYYLMGVLLRTKQPHRQLDFCNKRTLPAFPFAFHSGHSLHNCRVPVRWPNYPYRPVLYPICCLFRHDFCSMGTKSIYQTRAFTHGGNSFTVCILSLSIEAIRKKAKVFFGQQLFVSMLLRFRF